MCEVKEWHPDYWVCACGESHDHGELCDKDAARLRAWQESAEDMASGQPGGVEQTAAECRARSY